MMHPSRWRGVQLSIENRGRGGEWYPRRRVGHRRREYGLERRGGGEARYIFGGAEPPTKEV